MSMVLYLSTNIEIPINDEDNIEESLCVVGSYREEGLTSQRSVFPTLFAYETDFQLWVHKAFVE